MKTDAYLEYVQSTIDGHWTRGTLYRDSRKEITLKQSDAEYFCVLGAFKKTSSLVSDLVHGEAISAFISAIGTNRIDNWNDDGKLKEADMLAAFDRAREIHKEKNGVS